MMEESSELDLGDALGGGDFDLSDALGGGGGNFDLDDLKDAVDGGYNPDENKGRSAEAGSGQLAGIISAVGVAVFGAASSYFAYQKKKLCFKVQGGNQQPQGQCDVSKLCLTAMDRLHPSENMASISQSLDFPPVYFSFFPFFASRGRWKLRGDARLVQRTVLALLWNLVALIVQISDCIRDLIRWISLVIQLFYLSQNRISSIDANLFQRLTSLKELYLQGNNISMLPHGIFSCGTLSILDLSNNQISTLEEGMFHNLFNLSEINLSLNPFVCDCKLFQLIRWIAEQGVVVRHAQSTQCAEPPEVENLPLLSVNVSSITCGLSYAACLLDKHTGRKELVIFSSLTSGNFTRNSCNALCFSTHQPYGGLGTKNECLCGTNFEPNLISESQCSAACSDHLVMRDCRWTVAQQAFMVEFSAYFTQLGTFSIHEEAKLNISISVSVSTLLWDFGDRTPLLNTTKASASHKYALPGKYRVNVTLFARAEVISIQTEVNVIIPPRLELKCPTAVTTNDSIDIRIANWDGTDGTVDWNIVSESGEIGKAPFCPSDGLLHIGSRRCYQLIRSNYTWQEAQQFCASHGNGDLATVTNQDVKNLLITLIGNERDAWIGLWYSESDRSLKWVDGSATDDLETLLTGEPASRSENTCLTMDSSGQWNPKLCSTRAASICEYRHQPQGCGEHCVATAVCQTEAVSNMTGVCPARSQPEYSLVHEVLFTLLPAVSTHYLSYFRVNHSDWITDSLDNTTLRNCTEEGVCSLRVLYTQKKVKFIESPLLKAGLTTPGMYTFHAAVESKPFSRNLSCTFQVAPPLGLTIVYPPVQDDTVYFPTNKTFLLLKITSWHNATARWHGNNQSFPFQTTCPEEIASLIEDCKMNSSGTLFSRIDLELINASVVSVVITADNELSSENQTVKVKTEDPVRGLRVVPDPHQRVLVNSLVSYTAVVDSGSDVTFKWTVDDKPSFTYYNTALNVIYQNAAIYKLSVTALNHVSSLVAEFNVTVDRMNMMADLRVIGVPAVIPQSSSETLTASVKVDTAVEATFRWTFGDGGYDTYHFKPPYDISLQVQDTSVNQALLQHNVTYTYQQPGEYTLTVSVSNKYENISQLIQVFVYSNLTSVGIIVDTEALVVGSTAAFEAHPLPSPYGIIYTWRFGDGSSPVQGRERRVNHTFNQSGVYNISVCANNTISSTDSQRSVLVFEEITGDLIHLVNQPPPQPTTDDNFNDRHPLLVASKAYNLSSELMRILMHSRVLNEEPLVLHGTEITTVGKRAHPLSLLCFPDGPLCPFSIPKEFNSTFRDMTGIVQVMFQVDSNPFPFGYVGNYTVSTEVASMEFQTANGTQIPISSLGASKAITVMVSNSTGVQTNSSWTQVVSEWSSVIVLVTTGNTNKAAGLHIQVMFTMLNDGAAASEEEPYITAYLHSYLNPNEYNCTAQKRITLSMTKGPDHKLYTFFISPDVFDTTKDYYLNVTNGCWRSPVRVKVGVYTSLCQYFNNQEMRWKTDGMVPLESTTPDKAVCLTEHLTAFGASLFVPLDAVRFIIPAPSPGMNYIVLLTCVVCFITYSVVAVIVRKLDLIDINRAGVIPFCGKDGLYKYEIQVKTGWGRGSGTTAHVGISLYGTDSKSGHRHLDGWNVFLRNSLDIFHMSTDSSLGSIFKIRVWHDNKGLSPSWYLQYVIVKDLQTSKKYFFLINDWLSVDNDDNEGMVEKEVIAATDAELRHVSRIFVGELERGLSEKHIWLSLWERPARSRFTRVQRATCCAVLIYLFILANAVWYGLVGDKTRSPVPVSNLMPVNVETVAVGMVACVIVYPVYLIVLTLFRMARSKASVEPPVAQLEQQSLEIDDYLDSSTIGNSFLTFSGVSGETYSEQINSDISVAASKSMQNSNSQEGVVPHWPDLLNDPSIVANNLPKLKRGQGSRHLGVDMALTSEEEDFYSNRNKYFTASDEDLIKKILADGHRQASRLQDSQLYLSQTETELADLSTIFGDKTEVILLQQLNEPGPTGTARREPPQSAHTSRTAVMDVSAQRLFPHWCSHAAHVLSFILLAGSIGISVWIGMGFGSSVALMWLLSGIFSFLASFFVLEPLKVLLEALYFTLIAKRILPEERDTLVENPQVQHVSEKIQRVRAPQGFALFQAKEEAKKVRKLHRMLKSFLVYMFFLLVMLLTSYGDSFRDTNARHLQSLVHQRLDTTEFISIEKPEEFWIWLSHVLLPYLYSNETMRETNSILLGVPRLRQIRMQNGCPISNYLEPSLAERGCIQFTPIVDTRSYGLGWGSQDLNQSNTWTYFPPDLTGVWYWGKLSIYNSGGYVKELKRTMNDSIATLLDLQRNNWLDRMTRAVFVEFTLYNTNTDLYAVVALLVEFAHSSRAYTSMNIKAVPLLRLSTGADLLLVMMGFLVVFVVYFVVHETRIMKKEGSSYFSQPWNLVQWSVIVLTLAAVVVHLNRISIADKQWHTFLNHRDGFTNFYQIAFLSYAFTSLAAVVLFLLILKASVQLRFLRDWSMFGKTLCRSVRELLAAGVALTLLLLAYSHLGYLVFSSSMEGYSSFSSSVLSLLSTLRGLGSLKACLPEQRSAVCYVFYISYTVIDMWIILRIFAVILIRNYNVVRFEMYRPAIEPQDYEMMELFLRRLKMWMGISKTKEFRHKVRFEGMEPLPSRASTDSKSLYLPTPDSASDISSNSTTSSHADCFQPVVSRERAEAEAALHRLLPVFETLLLQLDRVNKVTEDVYQAECCLEHIQTKINKNKYVQMTQILLNKYCTMSKSSSAGKSSSNHLDHKSHPRKGKARPLDPDWTKRSKGASLAEETTVGPQMPNAPSSLFRHPAHTTTVPVKKRKPPAMKNKVHPNTDRHVSSHLKS
ncbi:UNVERIFIED_CONTAM: hypothetical protein FKN15_016038 [Acipenser sinensis]